MERLGEKVVESSVEARQGFLGSPVLVNRLCALLGR
jgi:hypothetical protein